MKKLRGGMGALAAGWALLALSSSQVFATDPEYSEALAYSAMRTAVAEPVSCGSSGAPDGSDFSLAGIDAETRRLSTATSLDPESFCNDPVAVACNSTAVRGKYLAQIKTAMETMAALPPKQLPSPFPDWHVLGNQIKDRMRGYMVGAAEDAAIQACKQNNLTMDQCSCVRSEGMSTAISNYLKSIQLFVGTPNTGMCTAGAVNGQFQPRASDSPSSHASIIICPIGILAAYDAQGNPQEPGYSNLVHLVSHEVGHSFDPIGMFQLATDSVVNCKYDHYDAWGKHAVSEDVRFSPTKIVKAAYDASPFVSCAKSFAPPEPPHEGFSLSNISVADQTAMEVAADAFAARITPNSINPRLSNEDLMSATSWLCDGSNSPNTDGHPPGNSRIQAYAKVLHARLCPNNTTNYGQVPACAVPH